MLYKDREGKLMQFLNFCLLKSVKSINEQMSIYKHKPSGPEQIVRKVIVLNSVGVDGDWRFDNLCGSHLQSLSELYHVSWWH